MQGDPSKLPEKVAPHDHDSLAEWSKALASGASPKGRGFEPHSCHLLTLGISVITSLES